MSKKRLTAAMLLMATAFVIGVYAKKQAKTHVVVVPYELEYAETLYKADGTHELLRQGIRSVSADGRYRDEYRERDGSQKVFYGEPGRGTFMVSEGHIVTYVLSESYTPVTTPSDELKRTVLASAKNAHLETVAGVECVVYDDPSGEAKTWQAPSLNNSLIKRSLTVDSGESLLEPIKLTLGEPSSDHLTHANLPLDTTWFEKRYGRKPNVQ